ECTGYDGYRKGSTNDCTNDDREAEPPLRPADSSLEGKHPAPKAEIAAVISRRHRVGAMPVLPRRSPQNAQLEYNVNPEHHKHEQRRTRSRIVLSTGRVSGQQKRKCA